MTDSKEEMMEKLLIKSATTDVDAKHEDYSEWRLFHVGLGSAFQFVTVNDGFQNRDFQTIQGDESVIDAEVLGKLRKEASIIWNNMIRCHLACLVAMYLFFIAFLWFGFNGLGFEPDVLCFIVSLGVVLFLFYVVGRYLRKNADTRLTALVETYQPIFLNEYGVEIGYGRFILCGWSKLPALYLRRPQRLVDEEVAPDCGDSDDLDGRFPPIYLSRLIPGEIHIDEKEHDAASMKVDAQTWALLQSNHQKMIQWHPCMKTLYIVLLLVFYLGCYWLGTIQYGFICAWAFIYIGCWAFQYAVDNRNLRVYQDVAKGVNEALREDKDSRVVVEFYTSEVPGREGIHSRRYQFVQLDLSPRKELV